MFNLMCPLIVKFRFNDLDLSNGLDSLIIMTQIGDKQCSEKSPDWPHLVTNQNAFSLCLVNLIKM